MPETLKRYVVRPGYVVIIPSQRGEGQLRYEEGEIVELSYEMASKHRPRLWSVDQDDQPVVPEEQKPRPKVRHMPGPPQDRAMRSPRSGGRRTATTKVTDGGSGSDDGD